MVKTIAVLGLLMFGCAEATDASADAPPLGTAHDGKADADAVDAGARACDAAAGTLSGRATYVAGSAAAADPSAPAPFHDPQTCGQWVATNEGSLVQAITVTAGAASQGQLALVAAAAGADGCSYTLRLSLPASNANQPCAMTIDYVLVVP